MDGLSGRHTAPLSFQPESREPCPSGFILAGAECMIEQPSTPDIPRPPDPVDKPPPDIKPVPPPDIPVPSPDVQPTFPERGNGPGVI